MTAKPASSPTDDNQSFLDLADELKNLYSRWGIPFRPYVDRSLPHFSKQLAPQKKQILASLQETLGLYADMTAKGESPTDSARFLWRTMQRLGWRLLSDISDKIESGDVIEVYSTQNIQVFRNLNFFRFISITLEEMCCFAWFQIAEMDPPAVEFYMTLAPKMITNQIPATFRSPLKPYKVKEKRGDLCLMEIQPKWISPVFEGKQCVGVISVVGCRMIDPPDVEED